MSRALTELARQCRDEGWTVEQTAGNHLKWTAPNGCFVYSSLTPQSDSLDAHKVLLRKAWPEWRPRVKRPADKPRRDRQKPKIKRGRLVTGPAKQPWNPAQVPDAPRPTLAQIWPADDLITIPKPPTLW